MNVVASNYKPEPSVDEAKGCLVIYWNMSRVFRGHQQVDITLAEVFAQLNVCINITDGSNRYKYLNTRLRILVEDILKEHNRDN